MADRMSVDQLKEALQNKTLPAYIAIPLIEEKMNMQDRMRNSAAMQQPQQAPIADRVMQRAETSGIDRLPSNLAPAQGMAGGGIVAFEEGGEVPRYAGPYYGSLVKDPYAQPETQRIPGRGFETPQADPELLKRQLAQIDAQINATPAGRGRVFLENKRNEIRTALGMSPIVGQPRATPTDTGIAPPKVDATLPDTAVAPPTAPATTSRPAATTGASDQGIAAGLPKPPEFPSAVSTTEKLLGDYFKRSADTEKRLAEDLSKNRLQGKAFETYEQSLKKEAEQAGLDKDQAKYMAMLKAGLAMMAGTSRHALENIGKGALAGAADYQEAYKELRKAERERTKEFALIEQARRAEEKGELDLSRQLRIRAADAENKNNQFGANAVMQATGADRDTALNIWGTQYKTGAQIQIGRERNAALVGAAGLRGAGRGGITEYQMSQIYKDAMKEITLDSVRGQLKKELKLSKIPDPGVDKSFDERVKKAYDKQIQDYVAGRLGGSSGSGASQGFSLIGTEE